MTAPASDPRGGKAPYRVAPAYAGIGSRQTRSDVLALMQALSADQQAKATIGTTIPRDVLTTAQVDNLELAYAGIRYGELTPLQQDLFLKLVGVYVGRIRPGHAEIRMDEVKQHLADTYFGVVVEGRHKYGKSYIAREFITSHAGKQRVLWYNLTPGGELKAGLHHDRRHVHVIHCGYAASKLKSAR